MHTYPTLWGNICQRRELHYPLYYTSPFPFASIQRRTLLRCILHLYFFRRYLLLSSSLLLSFIFISLYLSYSWSSLYSISFHLIFSSFSLRRQQALLILSLTLIPFPLLPYFLNIGFFDSLMTLPFFVHAPGMPQPSLLLYFSHSFRLLWNLTH